MTIIAIKAKIVSIKIGGKRLNKFKSGGNVFLIKLEMKQKQKAKIIHGKG